MHLLGFALDITLRFVLAAKGTSFESHFGLNFLEIYMHLLGFEPRSPAWKAGILAIVLQERLNK